MDPTLPQTEAMPGPLPADTLVAHRFRLEHLAGVGGMGEVYRAWDLRLQRPVALKRLRHMADLDQPARVRFHREAQALAQLNHPQVCQVYDLLKDPAGAFIAMEWLEGETLDLALQGLDLTRRCRLLQQAAEGLAAAHAQGLVHRDLKPRNMMVQGGQLKILDFGLVRLGTVADPEARLQDLEPLSTGSAPPRLPLDLGGLETGIQATPETHPGERTQQGFFLGSPRYASPEQVRGHLVEPPSDVFSLGIIAWEVLTGTHPYLGEGQARLQNLLAGRRLPLPARLPRRLRELLARLLDLDPARRPRAAEVAALLARQGRPLRPWVWISLTALLTTGLAVAVHQVRSRGILADLTRTRPARVLILPPQVLTEDPDLRVQARYVVPDLLASGLGLGPRLQPLPAQGIEDLLRREPALAEGQLPGAEALPRLCRAVGADLLLATQLQGGAHPRLAYQLIDARGHVRARGEVHESVAGLACLQTLPLQVARLLRKAADPQASAPDPEGLPWPQEALRIYAQGRRAFDQGDYTSAAPLLRQAATAAPEFAQAAVALGMSLRRLGDPGASLALQWGRMAARHARQGRIEVQAITELAFLHQDQGQWDQAARHLDQAQALAQAARDEDLQSALLNNRALLAMERKVPDEAQVLLTQALRLHQKLGKTTDALRTLNNLAILAKEAGRPEEARTCYGQVLEQAQAAGDRSQESMALNNLGDVALALGRFPEAEGHFQASLALKRSMGQAGGSIIPLANLGILARVRGDFPQARQRLTEALALCRQHQKRPLEAVILLQLGETDLAAQADEGALRSFRAAAQLCRSLEDADGRAQALAGEAMVLLRQRREAGALIAQARTLAPTSLHVLRASALHRHQAGQTAEARGLLDQALATARKGAPEEVPGLEALGRQFR